MPALALPNQKRRFLADLLDPAKGYVLVKGCFTEAEIDHYREECEVFLQEGPVCHAKIMTDTICDYVHPRSHDPLDEVTRTYRIYQHLHNRHSASTEAFLAKALALRNAMEETWTDNATYRTERLQLKEYMIVTTYVPNTGYLPRHRDYAGPAPFPLLQSLILLSRAPDDYTGGDFTLYPRSGAPLNLERDLGVEKGDLFLFDKSLDHSVELTRPGTKTNRRRWSVLVGARAPRDTTTHAALKRALYSDPQYRYTGLLGKVLRKIGIPA
jgi:Oxygenase, catalysing oxidative methylation of damaged DNA